MIDFPSFSHFEQVEEYLKRYNVRYIIITRDVLKYRQEVLGRFFVWIEDSGLIQKRPIPNWELVSQDIPDSLIYRRW
jgi:tRNA isopentenyl-2-thiomethyl-A-37 hydroxylase MiaE